MCVHDQIELSVEKLQQDPLVSFTSFPVEFVNKCRGNFRTAVVFGAAY